MQIDRDARSKTNNLLKLFIILSASFHPVTTDDNDGKSEHADVER